MNKNACMNIKIKSLNEDTLMGGNTNHKVNKKKILASLSPFKLISETENRVGFLLPLLLVV